MEIFSLFFAIGLASFAQPCFAKEDDLRLSSEDIMKMGKIPEQKFAPKSIGEAIASTKIKEAVAPSGKDVIKMGDMFLTKDQFDLLYGNESHSYNGVTSEYLRWTQGIIPYVISSEMSRYKNNIIGGMKEWMENTCLKFEPYSSSLSRKVGHNNRIKIYNGQGCNSQVGMVRWGEQLVSLEAGGCTMHSTVVHELGHAIGLHHEQDRPDRDQYLKIIWDNIPRRWQFAFQVKSGVHNFGMKLDYCSIMEYDAYSFSENNQPTIVTRDPEYQFTIGKLNHGTFEDFKIINIMYKCNKKCPAQPKCKDPCYVNHKCQCLCPTGECCKNKRPCGDYNSNCAQWARTGACRNNAWYMRSNCPKSCGVCDQFARLRGSPIKTPCDNDDMDGTEGGDGNGGDGNGGDGDGGDGNGGDGNGGDGNGGDGNGGDGNEGGSEGPKCLNHNDRCQEWADRGECDNNGHYMIPNCPKACGMCKDCGDKNDRCEEWANRGECENNPWYMLANCNQACGLCK